MVSLAIIHIRLWSIVVTVAMIVISCRENAPFLEIKSHEVRDECPFTGDLSPRITFHRHFNDTRRDQTITMIIQSESFLCQPRVAITWANEGVEDNERTYSEGSASVEVPPGSLLIFHSYCVSSDTVTLACEGKVELFLQ